MIWFGLGFFVRYLGLFWGFFLKRHFALMGAQCKIRFYSLILAGFSNTFLNGTEGVFHVEVLMVAEECKMPHAHPRSCCQLLCSTLTLPHCGHGAVIHSQVMLQVAAGA